VTSAADALWRRLVAAHGPLVLTDALPVDAQRAALDVGRVLRVEVTSDGFGSGQVRMVRPDLASTEPPLRYGARHLESWGFVVFASPPGLTDAERALLADPWANGWERWSEVPHLPP